MYIYMHRERDIHICTHDFDTSVCMDRQPSYMSRSQATEPGLRRALPPLGRTCSSGLGELPPPWPPRFQARPKDSETLLTGLLSVEEACTLFGTQHAECACFWGSSPKLRLMELRTIIHSLDCFSLGDFGCPSCLTVPVAIDQACEGQHASYLNLAKLQET